MSDWFEPPQFYEVEGRPVIVTIIANLTEAWVWRTGKWRYAPGLPAKALFWGERISPEEFLRRFPEVDMKHPSLLDPSFSAA